VNRIAVLSDTHGLLRPEVLPRIQGVDLILHAGDVGSPEIVRQLGEIAPVHAVRGNTDHGAFGHCLPLTDCVDTGHGLFYLIHIREDLDLNPAKADFSHVIYGHTHSPALESIDGVTYLNPGSIGPRRFRLPISFALLEWRGDRFETEFVTLEPTP